MGSLSAGYFCAGIHPATSAAHRSSLVVGAWHGFVSRRACARGRETAEYLRSRSATDHLLARSGVTEAHKRLGADPVEWLFRKTGTQWGGERYSGDAWHDLQVFSVDGALLRTHDTLELREHFGSGNTPTDRQSYLSP